MNVTPSKIRNIGNENEWRLPTRDELMSFGKNVGFKDGHYWTGTETGKYTAYYVDYTDYFDGKPHYVNDGNKAGFAHARLIKSTEKGIIIAHQDVVGPSGDSLMSWEEAVEIAQGKQIAENMVNELNAEIDNL